MEETKGKLKEKKTRQALFYKKIDHVICHMTICLKNLKIDKTGGGFKKRSQAVSFFSFILTNFYHFTFGMTVHCTSIKKKKTEQKHHFNAQI